MNTFEVLKRVAYGIESFGLAIAGTVLFVLAGTTLINIEFDLAVQNNNSGSSSFGNPGNHNLELFVLYSIGSIVTLFAAFHYIGLAVGRGMVKMATVMQDGLSKTFPGSNDSNSEETKP